MKHFTLQTVKNLSADEPAWLQAWRKSAFDEWMTVGDRPQPTVRRTALDSSQFESLDPTTFNGDTSAMVDVGNTAPKGLDEMELVNRAFMNQACVIRLTKSEVVSLETTLEDDALLEYILVIADEGVNGAVTIKTEGGKKGDVHFQTVHVVAKSDAQVTVTLLEDTPSDHFVSRRAEVGQNASVDWVEGVFGSEMTRITSDAQLVEQGATISRKSMFVGESGIFDVKEDVVHDAPHTTSSFVSKATLSGNAKVTQQGTIHMTKNAAQAVGSERMDTLMLSADAQANPVPVLEIERDDVQVSHASTTGRIDPAQVFYLQSRGLTKEEARKEIARGSINSILDQMTDPAAVDWVKERLESATI